VPESRASATQALDLPYLTDRLLSDEAARDVLKFLQKFQSDRSLRRNPPSEREEPEPIGAPQREQLNTTLVELREAELFVIKRAEYDSDDKSVATETSGKEEEDRPTSAQARARQVIRLPKGKPKPRSPPAED
jgi:hypothetical protein